MLDGTGSAMQLAFSSGSLHFGSAAAPVWWPGLPNQNQGVTGKSVGQPAVP